VTIAIPTFRRPDMLRDAIESALAQTYRNTEVLVSDSDADPSIADLVASYGDPRVRYRDNGEVSTATSNALAMYTAARGEFIGTLHDDDLWEPDFLDSLVSPLVADESLVLAFCDHWVIDADGSLRLDLTEAEARKRGRVGLRPGVHRPFLDLATSVRAVSVSVAAVFRSSAIDWSEFRHEAASVYDMWMAYLLARDGGGAWYEPRRLSRYRHHPAAASSAVRLDEAAVWVFDQFLADDRLCALRPGLHRAAAPHHTGLALSALRDGVPGGRQEAAHHLRAATRGGLRLPIAVGWALWPFPLRARRAVIDTTRTVRAHRAARGAGPDAISGPGASEALARSWRPDAGTPRSG
jgi:hypothetical protein